MTAAVIALAVAVAGSLAIVASLVYALLSGLRSERASFAAEVIAGKAQIAAEFAQRQAERNMQTAEDARDGALAARAQVEAERDAATTALADTQRHLNEVLQENADATVTKIRSAPSIEHAVDALNELLKASTRGEAVPGAGSVGAPAGDDRSHA